MTLTTTVWRRALARAGLVVAAATVLAACASAAQPDEGPTNGGASTAATSAATSAAAPSTPASGTALTSSPAGSGPNRPTEAPDPMFADLTGRTFYSTEVAGHDLVKGTRITLAFPSAGMLSATAGCNTMSGGWTAGGDRLVTGDMATTLMGCAADLMAQDTWLAQQLGKGVTVHLDGDTLTLATADGTTITLVDRKTAEPDLPLVGTTWTLESVVAGGAATSYSDVTATMTIADDRISFHACNSHSGDIEITGNTATTSKMLGTTMACPDDREQVERAMESVLSGTFTFGIDGNRLTVTGEDGNGLTFTGTPSTTAGGGASSTAPTAPTAPTVPIVPTAPASSASPIVTSGPGARPPGFPGTTASLTPVTSKSIGRHDSIPPQPSPDASGVSN